MQQSETEIDSLDATAAFPTLVALCRVKYAGDNFVRNSGDTVRMAQAQGWWFVV